MNKCFIILALIVLSCDPPADNNKNNGITDIERKMILDEEEYAVFGPDSRFKNRIINFWIAGYDSIGYNQYEKKIDTLLQYGYLRAAEAMASKVKINEIHPHKRVNFYESMGIITKYTSKPDSAIYYFRYVYLLYPKVPAYVGHNQLHFYNEAVMTSIEAERCEESRIYLDSLMMTVEKFPDSLFYIGGDLRLEEFRNYISMICK